MKTVDAPASIPDPPAELGRLGPALGWLAAAQGAWPPRAPRQRRLLSVGLDGGTSYPTGSDEADSIADQGVDLLTVEGPPASVAALIVMCALLDIEPVLAVGTALQAGWAELVTGVRDGLPAARAITGDPEQLVADPLLGRVTGLLAQCAVRRTPVVLGGSPVLAAAALAAERMAPGARRWWLAASTSPSSAVGLAYADLALSPMLDLGLSRGGAELATGLLVGAVALTSTG